MSVLRLPFAISCTFALWAQCMIAHRCMLFLHTTGHTESFIASQIACSKGNLSRALSRLEYHRLSQVPFEASLASSLPPNPIRYVNLSPLLTHIAVFHNFEYEIHQQQAPFRSSIAKAFAFPHHGFVPPSVMTMHPTVGGSAAVQALPGRIWSKYFNQVSGFLQQFSKNSIPYPTFTGFALHNRIGNWSWGYKSVLIPYDIRSNGQWAWQ